MSDALYAYSGNDSSPFANASLVAGKLVWSARADLKKCAALRLSEHDGDAANLNIWFVVDANSLVLDANGFPQFNVSTPFGLLPKVTLSYGHVWTFAGIVQANGFSFDLPADNTQQFPADQSLSLQTAPFTSKPANWTIEVPTDGGAAPSVNIGFQPTENVGEWTLVLVAAAVNLGGNFWPSFTKGQQFSLTFRYLPGLNADGTPSRPQPCLELTGFGDSVNSYWNSSIAQPYQVSVPTAEPDAPISGIWTIPSNARGWIYRSFVSLQVAGDFNSAIVTWQPGCFTLSGAWTFLMPDLFTHSGEIFQGAVTLLPAIPDATLTAKFAPRLAAALASTAPLLAFRVSTLTLSAAQALRLGALDLSFSATSCGQPAGSWHVLGYVEPGNPIARPRISVQNLLLPVDLVQVGSEDPLADDTGDLPLVIPLAAATPPAAPPAPPSTLEIAEQNPLGKQRTLTLTLRQITPGGGSGASLLILDRNPFFIARVSLPSLLGISNAAGAVVAEWSNTYPYGEGWHTQSGAQVVTVTLPSQGIGEQMERERDIPPGATLDYRFSPAAQLQIAPPVLSGDTENYFEAPWNLRRLLASPGQNVPGSPLPSFSAEFLYGLPVTVTSSALRLAEISALTGRLADPMASGTNPNPNDPYNQAVAGWNQTLQAFQTRLAAILPWDGSDPDSLLLSDEAQYTLRTSADLAYPATTPVPPGNPPYPNPPAGLKGGVGWIFESENQYRQIWQQPRSTSALLADPAFSALGGWARQRAVFQDGITTINSHVEMGRVSTISVEVLGRIGALWNRAKHVTVYERTVQASDQFANSQYPLQGQPILRKVEEYVELLEPIRTYPESGAGSINVACVLGSEFKSKVIYVDSTWGSDVSSGWQVPLWNPAANPIVYPKPHILLNVAVDPATGVSSQSQEITDPQKLAFYTTGDAGPNPDLWTPVLSVDFADVDTTIQSANQSYRLATSPGLGAFTWNLTPGKFSANVVAQRTGASISAGLKNVSMMRSKPVPVQGTTAPPLLKLSQVADHASSLFQEVADNLSLGSLTDVFQNQSLGGYFDDLTAAASGAVPTGPVNLQSIGSLCTATFQQATAGAADLFTSVFQTIENAVNAPGANDAAIAALATVQAQILNSALGNFNPDVLPPALPSAIADLGKIAGAIPTDAAITNSFPSGTLAQLTALQSTVVQSLQAAALHLAPLTGAAGNQFSPGWVQLSTLEPLVAQQIGASLDGSAALPALLSAIATLRSDVTAITQTLTTLQISLPVISLDIGNPPLAGITTLQQATQWLGSIPSPSIIDQTIANAETNLGKWITDPNNGAAWIPDSQTIQAALSNVSTNFKNLLLARGAISTNWAAFVPQLGSLQAQFASTMSTFAAAGANIAGTAATAVYSQSDPALRLFRAFGDPPVAPGLSFISDQLSPLQPLQQLAYFFDGTRPDVAITSGVQSTLATAAQGLSDLSPINLNVPIQSLLDRLVPDPALLAQQAISDIFQNLAGMNLSSLFAGLFPPLNAPDGIRITHSINPQNQQVEVEADIDVPFPNDVVVLNEGPVMLRLLTPRFQAAVTIDAGAGRQPVQQVTGNISGDWEVQIAGLSLVTFVSTSLNFDSNGHIRFDVSPERIQLASVMQFIADLVNSLNPPGSGLSIVFDPSPVSVVSTLDLPLPDIAGGVFALSNVRLGALFGVGLDNHNNFQFLVGMKLSQEDAPFAIVIFILGGGGWVNALMTYTIGQTPVVNVTVGISAIASLEIALGPISGGVMISFSLFAEYSSGASLDIGIVIVVAGHVSLLDIVDADITLMLEADYNAGQLTGRGSVSVDIKICWCFTLSIHQEVDYTFGNASGGQSAARAMALAAVPAAGSDSFWNAASDYVDMLNSPCLNGVIFGHAATRNRVG